MGSGYVFSDKFISTEEALEDFQLELLKKGYENVDDLEYHLIPMRCGIQSKLWIKNTCAIGLSAGFIEPLQSNGLHSIYQFIFNLCRTLERGHISEWDRREFTAKCHDDFYGFAAIVALSYSLSHRDDSEYWKEIQNREWSPELFAPSVSDRIARNLNTAFIDKNFNYAFNPQNSITACMAVGMNWNPIDIHSIKYNGININDYEKSIQQIEKRKKLWNEQVKDYPSPYQYLKNIRVDK
jgi:tryptophan halogenase